MTEREQQLIDITYQLVFAVKDNDAFFKDKNRQQIADWVTDQLTKCGFPVKACGCSWGVL